jgi:hypothetical protein
VYWLHISRPGDVEAEFTVGSIALAIDLALRSERAGLCWRAEMRADGQATAMTLEALRDAAATGALDELDRRFLDDVEWQHELQSTYRLN